MPAFLLPAFILCLIFSARALAGTFYVSTSGNDSNVGTEAAPWKTIQKAANSLQPGDTALVRGGVYAEAVTVNVSGSAAGGFVTFANYPGETPVLDGTTLTVPQNADTALFLMANRSHVVIRGFELRNYKSTSQSREPAGIFLRGACKNIEIRDCVIHDIWKTGGNTGSAGGAFGIAVYGSSTTPADRIIIDNNEIYGCKTGWSETLVINGNVTNWEVTNNRIHDCNNIGIDFIGFEGTCSDPLQDQARDGVCRGNQVWNITSEGNQAYTSGDYSAGGIYSDGGTRILIERNISRDNDIGVELASEMSGKLTSKITLRNNVIHGNRQTGLYLGGYQSSGTGGTDDCTITGNTFWNNDTLQWDIGEAQLRFRTSNCRFRNNIFFTGATNWLITVPVAAAQNVNNTFDYNLYHSAAGAAAVQWRWNNTKRTGFTAWKTISVQDANSLFTNPAFVSTATPDLHLQLNSPAIDKGDPGFAPATGEKDMDGAPRVTGARVDIGADELKPFVSWRVLKFGAQAANDAIAGPDADPNFDGIPNIVAYALGLPPTGIVPMPFLLPEISDDPSEDRFLSITFTLANEAVDAQVVVNSGDAPGSLLPGSTYGPAGDTPDTAQTTEIARSEDAGTTTLTVRDNTALDDADRRFMALSVTLQ